MGKLIAILVSLFALTAFADDTYMAKVHGDGPDKQVVESGGEVEVKSGGTLDVQAGATFTIGDGILAAGDLALAQGSILVGNASAVASALSAKADGRILVGNGTTITSVAVSGDATLTNAGFLDLAANSVGLTELGSFTRYVPAMIGKAGTTAGWVVGTANLGEVALPASQTGSTLVIPVTDLNIGDVVESFKVIAQIESAGNTVTLDADLRKLTNAAADPTDASIGAITQVSVTTDTAVASAKTLAAAETIASGESLYLLLTATTAASTDIRLLGVEVVVQ